jgi:hypothetical protein
MTAYDVPLNVYRNRAWAQTFVLQAAAGSPIDVSADELRLIVLPTSPVGLRGSPCCAAKPVLVNDYPQVSVNTVFFNTPDNVTGTLPCGELSWQFLRRSPSGADSSIVVCAGPLTVFDSPAFPP